MAKVLLFSALFLSLAYSFGVAQVNRRLVADNRNLNSLLTKIHGDIERAATSLFKEDAAEKILAACKEFPSPGE